MTPKTKLTDKTRLDWVTKRRVAVYPWGTCWTIGSLLNAENAYDTPRQAIDAAIRAERKQRGTR